MKHILCIIYIDFDERREKNPNNGNNKTITELKKFE